MAAGALVLAPHIAWLVANDFPPFTYALAVHGRRSFASATTGSLAYLAGAVAYVALPLAVYALAVRPGAALLRETVWPTDPRRRMLVVLLAVPLLLPALLAPFIGGRIVALWTMSAWFLLPVALLSPPGATVTRIALSRTAAGLAGVTVLALVAAPFIAILGARADLSESRPYYAAAARELTALWHATAPGPLPIVMGPEDLVTAITFYSPDHPDSVPGGSLAFSPWVTPARLAAEGWVLVCRGEQAWCGASADGLLRSEPGARRFDRTFTYDYAARGSGSGLAARQRSPVGS